MVKVKNNIAFFILCLVFGCILGRCIGQAITGFSDFLPQYSLEQMDNKVVPKYIDTYFPNGKKFDISKEFITNKVNDLPKEIDYSLDNYSFTQKGNTIYINLKFHKCFLSNKYKLIYVYINETKDSVEYRTFIHGFYKSREVSFHK